MYFSTFLLFPQYGPYFQLAIRIPFNDKFDTIKCYLILFLWLLLNFPKSPTDLLIYLIVFKLYIYERVHIAQHIHNSVKWPTCWSFNIYLIFYTSIDIAATFVVGCLGLLVFMWKGHFFMNFNVEKTITTDQHLRLGIFG